MLDPDDETSIKDAASGEAVLVTWDRVVREAAGGLTPYEAMHRALAEAQVQGKAEAAAELGRLRALTPTELTVMADAADKTARLFQRYIYVNPEQAQQARQLRVELGYSWRAIARWFSTMWGAPWGGNQLAGLVICEKAAKALGEDFMAPPWN